MDNKIVYTSFVDIKSSNEDNCVTLDGSCFSLCVHQSKGLLLICDSFNKVIRSYEKDGLRPASDKLVKLDRWFEYPLALCLASNEVYIAGELNDGIAVFNSELEFQRSLCGENVNFGDLMAMAFDEEEGHIYLTHQNSRLTKWDCKTGQLIREINVDRPRNVKIKNNRLLVINECSFDSENNPSAKLKGVTSGLNCVSVYEKSTLEKVDRLAAANWLQPAGLIFDHFGNLIVSAFSVSQNGFISNTRSLYVFDSNGVLRNEIRMQNLNSVLDMVLLQNELFVLTYSAEVFQLKKFSFK